MTDNNDGPKRDATLAERFFQRFDFSVRYLCGSSRCGQWFHHLSVEDVREFLEEEGRSIASKGVLAELDSLRAECERLRGLISNTTLLGCLRAGWNDSKATCISRNDPTEQWCRHCLATLATAPKAGETKE